MPEPHKILVIVPYPFDEAGIDRRRAQLGEVAVSPTTEFVYRPVKVDPATYDSFPDYLIADVAAYEAGIEAEREGYDAVCVDTTSDSGVEALRAVLDIPVIGASRASFLTALMFGDKFSIVTYGDPSADRLNLYLVDLYRKLLQSYGLADRCVSIRVADVDPDDENLFEGREDSVFPALLEACMQAIEDGADVICLGSTTMHRAHAFLAPRVPVPVINPGPLTYKIAETALSLGLTQSRTAYLKCKAPRPPVLHAMLDAAKNAAAALE